METSVVMSSTDPDGNEINRTYSGINPTATSEEITDFTEELNSLSDNTYVSTTRRDITHSDREAGLVAYTLPTAASDVKGGVMIGGGLSMDGDSLNVTFEAPAVFTGATSDTGGASGIVPAPQAGDDDKFLCGNGQWVTLQSGGTNFVPGTGLTMVGDTLNCTVGSSIILSTVASSVPGAMWLVY